MFVKISELDETTTLSDNDYFAVDKNENETLVTKKISFENVMGGVQDFVDQATASLNGLAFGTDSAGNWGYIKPGADTVTPFKTQAELDQAYQRGLVDGATSAATGGQSEQYALGYATGFNDATVAMTTGQYEITHHIHSLTTIDATEVNRTATVTGGYPDTHEADKSGGCFTKKVTKNLGDQTGFATGYYGVESTSDGAVYGYFGSDGWTCPVCHTVYGRVEKTRTTRGTEAGAAQNLNRQYTCTNTHKKSVYTCTCGKTNGQVLKMEYKPTTSN